MKLYLKRYETPLKKILSNFTVNTLIQGITILMIE